MTMDELRHDESPRFLHQIERKLTKLGLSSQTHKTVRIAIFADCTSPGEIISCLKRGCRIAQRDCHWACLRLHSCSGGISRTIRAGLRETDMAKNDGQIGNQEIRQSPPLQYRHQHLCDAGRPGRDGEEGRGFHGPGCQERRRHHPLGTDRRSFSSRNPRRATRSCRSRSCAN